MLLSFANLLMTCGVFLKGTLYRLARYPSISAQASDIAASQSVAIFASRSCSSSMYSSPMMVLFMSSFIISRTSSTVQYIPITYSLSLCLRCRFSCGAIRHLPKSISCIASSVSPVQVLIQHEHVLIRVLGQ